MVSIFVCGSSVPFLDPCHSLQLVIINQRVVYASFIGTARVSKFRKMTPGPGDVEAMQLGKIEFVEEWFFRRKKVENSIDMKRDE